MNLPLNNNYEPDYTADGIPLHGEEAFKGMHKAGKAFRTKKHCAKAISLTSILPSLLMVGMATPHACIWLVIKSPSRHAALSMSHMIA